MNWETEEVINTLINDPSEMLYVLKRMDEKEIEDFVKNGQAPEYLYSSFKRYNASFDDVDWYTVYEHL